MITERQKGCMRFLGVTDVTDVTNKTYYVSHTRAHEWGNRKKGYIGYIGYTAGGHSEAGRG